MTEHEMVHKTFENGLVIKTVGRSFVVTTQSGEYLASVGSVNDAHSFSQGWYARGIYESQEGEAK